MLKDKAAYDSAKEDLRKLDIALKQNKQKQETATGDDLEVLKTSWDAQRTIEMMLEEDVKEYEERIKPAFALRMLDGVGAYYAAQQEPHGFDKMWHTSIAGARFFDSKEEIEKLLEEEIPLGYFEIIPVIRRTPAKKESEKQITHYQNKISSVACKSEDDDEEDEHPFQRKKAYKK